MSARHSLTDLPLEVLHQVFVCLDTLHDRLQLSQVCRGMPAFSDNIQACGLLHQLFSESPTLQYELQLTVADQLDVPNGERPRPPGDPTEISTYKAKTKLELLKGREEAWRTLSYRAKSELFIDGAAGVYELQDSIFLMCDGYEPPMSHNGRVGPFSPYGPLLMFSQRSLDFYRYLEQTMKSCSVNVRHLRARSLTFRLQT